MRIILLAALFCIAALTQAQAADRAPWQFGQKYCAATGGTVQLRTPTFGTNGNTPLTLAYPQLFCDYAKTAQGNTTHIDVLLSTLITKQPTLAALAYYAKVPFSSAGCNGGPGSCYCAQVGGTDAFGGINLSGGGWVLSTDPNDVLDACVFPDRSIIDAYGLFYHSAGIIRGANLAAKLRYASPY